MPSPSALRLVVNNDTRAPRYSYCRLEDIDAVLIPVWYALPERLRTLLRLFVLLAGQYLAPKQAYRACQSDACEALRATPEAAHPPGSFRDLASALVAAVGNQD